MSHFNDAEGTEPINVSKESAAERRQSKIGAMTDLAPIALGLFALIALSAFGYIAYRSILSQNVSPIDATQVEDAGLIVESLFSTLQFSLSILSGVVIIFAAIISFVVGRNARQSQEETRQQLREMSGLYRQNLEQVSQALLVNTRKSVDDYLDEESVSATIDEYRVLLDKLKISYAEVEPIVSTYLKYKEATKDLEVDFSGPFHELNKKEESGDFNWTNQSERQAWQQALLKLEEGALKRRVASNDAYNGAQMAARLRMPDISHRLAVLANWLHSTPINGARILRSEYERGEQYKVAQNSDGDFYLESNNPNGDPEKANHIKQMALENVLKIALEAPVYKAELFYSELWNLGQNAEDLRYFIDPMERISASSKDGDKYFPSYGHALLSQAYALWGGSQWLEKSRSHLQVAQEKLSSESPLASWAPHARRLINSVRNDVFGNFAEDGRVTTQ